MSYRQSSYEPNRWEPQGPPVRPYNWVQWMGVGFIGLALLFVAAYFAGRAGLIPKWIDDPMPVFMFVLFGSLLIGSRREPVRDPQAQKRRIYMVLAVALAAAIIGAAVVIFVKSKGA